MSLNIGGFNRQSNPYAKPTSATNYVVPSNGSFQSVPQVVAPRVTTIFGVQGKVQQAPPVPQNIVASQAIIDQQQHNAVAQQTAQAQAQHLVPSIYNQTGKKS